MSQYIIYDQSGQRLPQKNYFKATKWENLENQSFYWTLFFNIHKLCHSKHIFTKHSLSSNGLLQVLCGHTKRNS